MGAAYCAGRCLQDAEPLGLDSSASKKMKELMARMQNLRFEPASVVATGGSKVRVRLATIDDKQYLEDIMDKEGVGAGHSGDPILLNCYESFLADPEMITLWAEDAEPPHANLGMIAVVLPTHRESFIHSLRVGTTARGKGIADILVKTCYKLCVQLQGAESIGRWGVVSSNQIMVNWSKRKNLHGPYGLVRFMGKPPEQGSSQKLSEVLPSGWTFRDVVEADASLIYRHFNGEDGAFDPVCRDYGDGVHLLRYGCFAQLNEDLVLKICQGHTWPPNFPQMDNAVSGVVLFDQDQKLVAFAMVTVSSNPRIPGSEKLRLFSFVSGTRAGMKALVEAILCESVKVDNCAGLLGYLPDVDWIHDMMAETPYKRGSNTTELVFNWPNAQFCEGLPP